MKRVLLLCAVFVAAAVQPAKADYFSISFNGGPLGYSGTGIFSGTLSSPGVYNITSVYSGSVTDPGFGTSKILTTSSYAMSDNELLFPDGGVYFDGSGLSFALANGVTVNLYDDAGGSEALESNVSGDIPESLVSETVATVTPEPNSFVLLGTSAVLGAGCLRRRRRFLA